MATLITKNSSTASSVPTAAQLVQGELAVNVTDKRLFTENSSGTVVELGTNPSTLALPNGTANGVAYLNGSKVLTTGSALTFNGTTLTAPQFYQTQNLAGAYNSQVLENSSSTGYTQFLFNVGSGGANGQAVIGYAPGLFFSLGPTSNDTTTPIVFRVNNGTEQMRLTSTGLGIGTSSPGAKLELYTAGTVNLRLNGSLAGGNTVDFYNYIPAVSNDGFSIFIGGTNRLTMTNSGNLGIGTISPSAKLTVNDGSSSASNTDSIVILENLAANTNRRGGIAWNDNNSVVGRIYTNYTGSTVDMVFGSLFSGAYNSNELMRLTGSGNLGIGVTPSAWDTNFKAFQLGGSGRNVAITGQGDADAMQLWSNAYRDTGGTERYIASRAAGKHVMNGNTFAWLTAPSGTAGNAISFTQAMTLTAGGDLVVGGTTQYGSARLTLTASGAYMSLNSTTVGYSLVRGFDNGTERWAIGQIGFGGADGMAFYTGTANTERARITSGGDLLVGTTSTYGGPGRINVGFNQSTNFGITLRNTSATATGVFVSFENSGGTGNGSISQTNSTTVAYNTSSDRRLKKNIVSAPQAGADIDAIQVVSHGWVSNDDTVKYGVIAQDLAVVAPLAVTKGDDGDEIERVWGVDYSKLVPMLIKEVQALRARVAALESNP